LQGSESGRVVTIGQNS